MPHLWSAQGAHVELRVCPIGVGRADTRPLPRGQGDPTEVPRDDRPRPSSARHPPRTQGACVEALLVAPGYWTHLGPLLPVL